MDLEVTPSYERVGPAPLSPNAVQHMVRMRDGVHLATDVYLPEGEAGAGPTVLIRLPYDKTGSYTFIPRIADFITTRGYRVVAQDVRGKFRSEGVPLMFVNEAYDGYDTLEWIEQQEWSDGVVGMWGDSYYGFTQWAAVSTGHSALRAISPRLTGTQLGTMPTREPDANTMEVELAVGRMYAATYFHDQDVHYWDVDWSRRPYIDSVERFFAQTGARSPSWDMVYPHAFPLRRFPGGGPFAARPVPVLMTIGWWDNCAPWQWADHAEIQRRPAWALNEFLVIDSIDHEGYHLSDGERTPLRSDVELDRITAVSLAPTLEFFDVFLREVGSVEQIPRVRWNLAHTPGFRQAAAWPPVGVAPQTLALTADGRLLPRDAGQGPDPAGPALEWVHDPDDLVPSPVENAFAFLLESPDERSWSERGDVLAFSSDPVSDATDLVGPVDFRGLISTSGPTIDVFVRLLDVAPDGEARLITRGQVHLPRPVGEEAVSVALGQVGYRLRAGHALRVHVASSDFPEYLPQPGTGVDPWVAVEGERNTQSLRAGAVLEFGRLAGSDTTPRSRHEEDGEQ